MDSLKRIVDGILNPRARLEKLRRPPTEDRENATGGSSNPAGARGRLGWRDVVFNLPLMIGLITVLGLFLLVLFGPV